MEAEHDPVERVRTVRHRLHRPGPTVERKPGDLAEVALPEADGDVLRDLLRAEQARVVIEIGLAYGGSALAIGEALADRPGARHVVIDAFQDRFGGVGWERIVEAGLERTCELHQERSQLALPRLIAEGVVADAAFVDGSHVFHHVFVDLAFLRDVVRPGGLVVLDDVDWPAVATALRYFEVNAGWMPVPIDRPTRLRAVRLPDPPVEPAFDDFQPFGI